MAATCAEVDLLQIARDRALLDADSGSGLEGSSEDNSLAV
eukprot:CAMPEP_0175087040 /NCGR_PEP_ID=MMETSP0052_2-20121109/29603_1 /TAXON_ID=51329 ORGANISM="Polytomella parva, Strain SAG 63-3" /NCGR_SAMPLE_ID=MMETSP0052_2 /ASSEMBLY_ACC=CAM_ASM_000194 /LENGTH=39 /DNA_ID= /DNA_START= /DNA_END= /DNA_ORIENTATION=